MGVLMKRKSPLFRRKTRRHASAIEAEVDYVVQRSPFLLAAETRAQHEQGNVALAATATAAFTRKELQTGGVLGSGSFSQVHSIVGFKLLSSSSSKRTSKQVHTDSTSTCSEASSGSLFDVRELRQNRRIKLAREAFGATGEPRYAVKFVRKELTKNSYEFRNAAADLVVEAKYLSALDHRNILKLRGTGVGDSAGFKEGHDGFFLILDRLEETLGERIERWKELRPQRPRKTELLAIQADYASQIADALAYLHDRRIIFRDLKPSNVGFRADGPHTVQLFDFGLCRELPATGENDPDQHDESYQMSGAGTFTFMAPEQVVAKRYNLKADVYSWAFLFHLMITLEQPFAEFSLEEHKEFVCEIGQRPSLAELDIPDSVQDVLREAWEQDPTERLTMRQVCGRMTPILEELNRCTIPAAIPPPPSFQEEVLQSSAEESQVVESSLGGEECY